MLSVDPSSPISGGSILGDKTRMERLAVEERAFIRPSPARGHLGGVARRTRETMLLCEAAGYHNILVETVGVGQSETAVRSMTDFFLLLMLAGAGDELQGMKRGIIEMLDGMAINKADGDNLLKAERARVEYASALHLFPASADGWTPRVLTCSALTGDGIARRLGDGAGASRADGNLRPFRRAPQPARRSNGCTNWWRSAWRTRSAATRPSPGGCPFCEQAVRQGRATPFAASRELLALFRRERLDLLCPHLFRFLRPRKQPRSSSTAKPSVSADSLPRARPRPFRWRLRRAPSASTRPDARSRSAC